MRPEMRRNDDGKLVKHWTMDAAEAADRERRERYQEQIRIARAHRSPRCSMLRDWISRLCGRKRRIPTERL